MCKASRTKSNSINYYDGVTTSTDDVLETQWICENCLLSLNGRVFHIDLICFPLKKIDIVF